MLAELVEPYAVGLLGDRLAQNVRMHYTRARASGGELVRTAGQWLRMTNGHVECAVLRPQYGPLASSWNQLHCAHVDRAAVVRAMRVSDHHEEEHGARV